MGCAKGDFGAERALDELMDQLTQAQRDVVVEPGTLLVVDNHLAVHGGRPFQARYDGADLWLKKLTASRNLRRNATTHRGDSHRILPRPHGHARASQGNVRIQDERGRAVEQVVRIFGSILILLRSPSVRPAAPRSLGIENCPAVRPRRRTRPAVLLRGCDIPVRR